MHRVLRSFLPLSIALASLATSCGTLRGLSLAPHPQRRADSLAWRDTVYAVAAAVAARHELTPYERPSDTRPSDAWTCYARPAAWFCLKANGAGMEIQLGNAGRGLSPAADSLRLELTEGLAARFGSEAVTPCQWRTEPDTARSHWWRSVRRSVCIAGAEGSAEDG